MSRGKQGRFCKIGRKFRPEGEKEYSKRQTSRVEVYRCLLYAFMQLRSSISQLIIHGHTQRAGYDHVDPAYSKCVKMNKKFERLC